MATGAPPPAREIETGWNTLEAWATIKNRGRVSKDVKRNNQRGGTYSIQFFDGRKPLNGYICRLEKRRCPATKRNGEECGRETIFLPYCAIHTRSILNVKVARRDPKIIVDNEDVDDVYDEDYSSNMLLPDQDFKHKSIGTFTLFAVSTKRNKDEDTVVFDRLDIILGVRLSDITEKQRSIESWEDAGKHVIKIPAIQDYLYFQCQRWLIGIVNYAQESSLANVRIKEHTVDGEAGIVLYAKRDIYHGEELLILENDTNRLHTILYSSERTTVSNQRRPNLRAFVDGSTRLV